MPAGFGRLLTLLFIQHLVILYGKRGRPDPERAIFSAGLRVRTSDYLTATGVQIGLECLYFWLYMPVRTILLRKAH